MIPPNLIINADDFGIHPRVSEAISLCLDQGLINSFSVLPFTDSFHRDLLRDILARHPQAKVGAHLTVLAPEGGMTEHPWHFLEFLAGYGLGRHSVARIRAAWEDQVRSLGGYLGGPDRLAHLDGHQHVHMLPGLWPAARDLQMKYRIPRIRVPYESMGRALFRKFPFGFALQAFSRLRRGEDGRRLIGFFTSTAFTVEGNLSLLKEIFAYPGRDYELMVHPALPAGAGSRGGAADQPALAAPLKDSAYATPSPGQEAEIEELRKLQDWFRLGSIEGA